MKFRSQALGCILCAAATMIGGCASALPTKEKTVQQTPMRIPDAVEREVRMHGPADGAVHARAHGRFRINPDTLFCEVPAEVDDFFRSLGRTGVGLVGVDDLLRSLGQEPYFDGSIRTITVSDPRCVSGENNIYHKGYALPSRSDKPFRIVMAVWQGDAYWVGQIEKEIDPDDARTWGPLPWRMGNPHINQVIFPAIDKIGSAFATQVRETR